MENRVVTGRLLGLGLVLVASLALAQLAAASLVTELPFPRVDLKLEPNSGPGAPAYAFDVFLVAEGGLLTTLDAALSGLAGGNPITATEIWGGSENDFPAWATPSIFLDEFLGPANSLQQGGEIAFFSGSALQGIGPFEAGALLPLGSVVFAQAPDVIVIPARGGVGPIVVYPVPEASLSSLLLMAGLALYRLRTAPDARPVLPAS
jgi:hypothetical protein